jgi:hypothetical protein
MICQPDGGQHMRENEQVVPLIENAGTQERPGKKRKKNTK